MRSTDANGSSEDGDAHTSIEDISTNFGDKGFSHFAASKAEIFFSRVLASSLLRRRSPSIDTKNGEMG
jgi:hypothetical protein